MQKICTKKPGLYYKVFDLTNGNTSWWDWFGSIKMERKKVLWVRTRKWPCGSILLRIRFAIGNLFSPKRNEMKHSWAQSCMIPMIPVFHAFLYTSPMFHHYNHTPLKATNTTRKDVFYVYIIPNLSFTRHSPGFFVLVTLKLIDLWLANSWGTETSDLEQAARSRFSILWPEDGVAWGFSRDVWGFLPLPCWWKRPNNQKKVGSRKGTLPKVTCFSDGLVHVEISIFGMIIFVM